MAFHLASVDAAAVAWEVADARVDYAAALVRMEHEAAAIRAGTAPERVWLLEHDHVYTAGTSAAPEELLDTQGVPVHRTGRGGRFTYHGPGQRVGYVMLDLKARRPDVRAYVHALEEWLIRTLAALDVIGERRPGRVGIWVAVPGGEAKIAALGVRLKRWVSLHGVALNVDPELARFAGIVPCGIREFGVTSLAALGKTTDPARIDAALEAAFEQVFGGPLARARPAPAAVDFAPVRR
ncbi:MAG: lipoyl(octanoyl) transferase LipB [Alphaproteobacteria bacterium]